MTDFKGKLPPQSIEAEQSLIGCMLLDKDAVILAAERLHAEDFYRMDHSEIFSAIMELFDNSKSIDIITVSDKLKQMGTLEKAGGMEYLGDLTSSVPTVTNAHYYASIVEEKAVLRKLIKISSDITKSCYEGTKEVNEVLEFAETGIFNISQKRTAQGVVHIKDILKSTFERLEELHKNKGQMTGVPSGFKDLDEILNGLQNSDLILVAARPGMGKTAFAVNVAQYAAITKKKTVAVFNLEMSKDQLVNRILSSEVMIEGTKMRTGDLKDEDWQKLGKVIGPASKAPLYIDDTPGITVSEIKAKSRRLKLEKGLDLIVIDYLQLLQGKNKESRTQEISEISRSLKIMAKELNIPVMALSQLSRAPEQRTNHRPMLSDLRESGAIEQDADIVMFLYRDDYYDPATEKPNIVEVNIAKNRNGSTHTIELRWFGEFTKFSNLRKS